MEFVQLQAFVPVMMVTLVSIVTNAWTIPSAILVDASIRHLTVLVMLAMKGGFVTKLSVRKDAIRNM